MPVQEFSPAIGIIEPLVESTPRAVVVTQTLFRHIDGTVEKVAADIRVAGIASFLLF
jgi:hypothetical protein